MDHVNVSHEAVVVVNEDDEFRQSENVNITMGSRDVRMEEAEDNIEIEVGMRFDNAEEVKRLYQEFAIRKGFAVMTRNSRKGPDGKVTYFIFACSSQGTYVSSTPTDVKATSSRMHCTAHITVTLRKDGFWYIQKCVHEHSHDLSPGKSRLFAKNRKMRLHVKRLVELDDEAGVRINKSFRSLVYEAEGYENVPFVERDMRNYMGQKGLTLGKEGDAKALLSYFARMQQQNSNFYYEIDLDDESRLRHVFWADARSRATYEYFGDVVTFDTTYLTNKYDMPFTPFVGVNHHGQSSLLGCGLVSSEETSSFVWLFETWLRCMGGKPPVGIVTDQCKAMQKAIEIVFPITRHRWCLWHIMKKILEKLKSYLQYKLMKNELKCVVYDSLSEAEFELAWTTFINKYGLEDNEWLSGLYHDRSKWVPCLLKKHFWAGMSTTHGSESVNAFFDGYINASTNLQQFVKQYENALHQKAEKEYEADFQSFNTILPCVSNSPIERQFQDEYTHSKFKEVQIEFRAKMNCTAACESVDGSLCLYKVIEDLYVGGNPREVKYVVRFSRDPVSVECNCLLFEFKGILCRHALTVLSQERVKEVSNVYLLPRWSKNVRRKHTYIKCSYDAKQHDPKMCRFDELCKDFYMVAEIAAETPEGTSLLAQTILGVKDKVKAVGASTQNLYSNEEVNRTEQVEERICQAADPVGEALV